MVGVQGRVSSAVVALVALLVLVAGCAELGALLDEGPAPSPLADASAAQRPEGVPADAEPAIVDRVVDGDTLRVIAPPGGTIPDGGSIRVRLLNIDAPELARDGRDAECLAEASSDRLEELLPPTALVWLAADVEDRDRFDRPLRGVWTEDGVFANELLAAEGLAEAVLFRPNDRFHARIVDAERRAVAGGLGIHGPACD
ncbi:MAG: thermonuclease family protein [Nitriliruptor sp.]|nr:MAG: thermonuclease family protein [Nitriliruptor sp.]